MVDAWYPTLKKLHWILELLHDFVKASNLLTFRAAEHYLTRVLPAFDFCGYGSGSYRDVPTISA